LYSPSFAPKSGTTRVSKQPDSVRPPTRAVPLIESATASRTLKQDRSAFPGVATADCSRRATALATSRPLMKPLGSKTPSGSTVSPLAKRASHLVVQMVAASFT
ncbi:hypothetical protein BGZ97_007727, partial [Linnemannia gamsii]